MQHRYIHSTILTILSLLTLVALLATTPSAATTAEYMPEAVVYVLLTAFALYFSVWLEQGSELSAAHTIGIMGFLSLGQQSFPLILWAVFAGGLLGGLLQMAQAWLQPGQRRGWGGAATPLWLVVRVTASFYAAGQLYLATGAPLPIQRPVGDDIVPYAGALLLYSLTYTALYLSIFLLQLYAERQSVRSILAANLPAILVVLLLPIPFALLAAEAADRQASPAFFVIAVTGAGLVLLGLYGLSRSEYRTRKQLDELRSISVAAQSMRDDLDLNTLLRTVYVQIANMLTADRFVVALYEDEETSLRYPFVVQEGRELRPPDNYTPPDYALIDHILRTRTPLLLADDPHEQARQLELKLESPGLESWIGVPLLAGKRLLGAITVGSEDPYDPFGADDLRLLNTIAASTSIAIENAQLYLQKSVRAEQLATLNKVSQLLTGTLSPDTVLDTIISSASTISEAKAIAVYLYWEETQTIPALVRSAGLSEAFLSNPPQPLLISQTHTGDILREPLVIEEVSSHPDTAALRPIMAREKIGAWVELPLHTTEGDLGVMVLYFSGAHNLSPEQLNMVQAFAVQATQAIHNARKFTSTDEALERRVEQLFSLAAMGRLLKASMESQQIYDLMLSYATEATRADRGAVAVLDASTNSLHVVAARGYEDDTFADPEVLRYGLTGRVLTTRQPVRSADVRRETSHLPLIAGTRSVLYIPILKGTELDGIIILESDSPAAFNEEDTHYVAQIANQAVIALENIAMFQQIRQTRDRQQIILNAMEEAVILVNSLGRVVLANPGISLIGLQVDRVIDRDVGELLDDAELNFSQRIGFNNPEEFQRLLLEVATPGVWRGYQPRLYEVQVEQGLRFIQRQIVPIRSEAERGVIGMMLVFYNKTEEQELERARDALSQMIVHDLRSPLTAVMTTLRLLPEIASSDSSSDSFKDVLDKTTDASRRALRKVLTRVDSLLDISRMESGELHLEREPSDLATIADSVCVELSPLAHELAVHISSEITDSTPPLDIDADKVERLLLNLVDNALKYSPSGSRVILRAHPPEVNAAPGYLRIDVVDYGPGIPAEYREKLFDRFVQVEGRQVVRRGVGLGLTFCKLVVEAHKGRVWIEDNPAGGSIFAFTLPVAQLEAPQE